MNRSEAITKTRRAVSDILRRQGYVSAVDVLMQLGMLDKADHDRWRMGQVPYLERVVRGSLPKVSTVVRTIAACCRDHGLQESQTDYRRWGKKGHKQSLRFSKSGNPAIERNYATHWVSKRILQERAAQSQEAREKAAQSREVSERAALAQPVHGPEPSGRRIETDPAVVERLAEGKMQANLELRQDLKFSPLSEKAIDAMFHRFHDEVNEAVDCTQCAQCCAKAGPVLVRRDVERLAQRLGITRAELRERYLRKEDRSVVFASQPCPFLLDRRCSVYEDRPRDCREFPHLSKRRMVGRLSSVVENSTICPIVYEVLERVRREHRARAGRVIR